MQCLFIFISSERQNNIIYKELIKAADKLKYLNQKKPEPILKSLTLKPCDNNQESFCPSEIYEITHDWENQLPMLGYEYQQISEDFQYNDYYELAECLHKICDEDIITGRTNVQIIWCVDKYAPCPSEAPEFYGAIERLKLWHNCSFNVVTNDESNVAEWSATFSFQIVKSCEMIVHEAINTIWMGRLGLTMENSTSLTEIGHVCLQTSIYASALSKFNDLNDSYMLPVAELFDDVELSSIPWGSIISGSICQLNISNYNEPDEKEMLMNLYTKIINRTGVGSLLRIRYSDTQPNLVHPESVQTINWKRSITDGQFTSTPSLQFKGYHQCQVFLLISEGSTKNKIYAIGLQDLNMCEEDVMKLTKGNSTNLLSTENTTEIDQNTENYIYGLLKETPELTPIHMAALSHLLVQLPINLRRCLEKNGQNVNNLWIETKEELEYITNCEIFKHVLMSRPPYYVLRSANTVLEPEIAAPMEYWPEYRALKKSKPLNGLNISTSSQNNLSSMSIPEGAPVSFKANQLLKFFSKNGKPSETINNKLVKFSPKEKNRFSRSYQQLNENETSWPESLHSKYHGIHYNTNTDKESFENLCYKFRDEWIVEETNSTCTPFQQKESISSWKSIPKTRPRSVNEGDKKSSLSGSSHRTMSQLSTVQEKLLRRSPRKKVKRDTDRSLIKASDLLKLENKDCKRPKRAARKTKPLSTELSDHHTRKLRNVVLCALQNNTISIDSSIFKNCFKKLFAVCKPFVADIIGLGSTTRSMEKIAKSHVKQVIEFETLKKK